MVGVSHCCRLSRRGCERRAVARTRGRWWARVGGGSLTLERVSSGGGLTGGGGGCRRRSKVARLRQLPEVGLGVGGAGGGGASRAWEER